MTLAQLQYFKTLAHILHYTRAAEKLHIAQPSLSYSINELEKELGVKLFVKEDRKISLTIYGEQFLPYVENALAMLDDGTEALRQMAGSAYQIVRLGYFHSIAASFIPPLIEDLYQIEENRRLRFQFVEAVSFDLLNQLKNGDLDISFSLHKDAAVESVPVFEQPLFLLAPADHPLAGRERVTFEEIAQEPMAMLDKTSSLRSFVDNLFSQQNITPNIMFVVRECNAAVQYVSLKLCTAILPQVPAFDSDKIRAVPINHNAKHLSRTVYFSWVKNRPLSAAARRVRSYIVGHYALEESNV